MIRPSGIHTKMLVDWGYLMEYECDIDVILVKYRFFHQTWLENPALIVEFPSELNLHG